MFPGIRCCCGSVDQVDHQPKFLFLATQDGAGVWQPGDETEQSTRCIYNIGVT